MKCKRCNRPIVICTDNDGDCTFKGYKHQYTGSHYCDFSSWPVSKRIAEPEVVPIGG